MTTASIPVPPNVRLGPGARVTGDHFSAPATFRKMKSTRDPAITAGADTLLDGATFSMGPNATVSIGDRCHLQDCLLVAELDIRIGHRVTIHFNATLVDSDFHPLAAEPRLADSLALSPENAGKLPRPSYVSRPIVIDDDVWIGPSAVILKGVHVGQGAVIEPGAVVTRDVPPRTRVLGNPAQPVGDAP